MREEWLGPMLRGDFYFLNSSRERQHARTIQERILLKLLQERECSLMRTVLKRRENTYVS